MNRLAAFAAALAIAASAAVANGMVQDETVRSAAVASYRSAGDAARGDAARGASAGCGAPASLTVIRPAQTHLAARIDRGEPLTIVAVGSSSTQGSGASRPDLTYPGRLEAELKDRFPAIAIQVINRGKGGEDAPEEFARLERDVIALHPDLVIWQIGTNAVLRRDDLTADGELIERGIARLKASGSDVVLMDMQYAPRVIARPDYLEMARLIENAAERNGVGLFRRFEITRHWQADPHADAEPMIGRDGLHMTDRGYFCLAANLAAALAANWWSREDAVERAPAARVAGLDGSQPRAKPPADAAR